VPHEFLRKAADKVGIDLPGAGEYGVGLVFLTTDVRESNYCQQAFEKIIREEKQKVLGWRNVPIDASQCGDAARDVMPEIRQPEIGEFFERYVWESERLPIAEYYGKLGIRLVEAPDGTPLRF
jgi:glutamate synthase domain-containing protein 1